MKQIRFIFTWFILVWLAACQTVEEPTPTVPAVSLAQTTVTTTPLSPTITATTTEIPPMTTTATTAPTQTIPPTATKPPLPTNTTRPTVTVTATIPPTPTISEPPLPPPPGYVIMLWSPEPEDIYAPLPVNMYFLRPEMTIENWSVQPVLTELVGVSPALSPDQAKLALSYFEDSNGDGQVSFQAGPDRSNVHLYNLEDGSLIQLTDNQIVEWPDVSWLPDNQTFTYALYKDIFQVNLSDSSVQPLLSMPGFIYYHAWSPDGRWLAIFSAMSDEPTQGSQAARLDIYDREAGSLVNIAESIGQGTLKWSPTSQYVAFTKETSQGLFLVNMSDFSVVELMSKDYLTYIDWSPDGHWLAFTRNHINERLNSSLVLWNASDFSTTELIVNDGRVGQPIWSPDGSTIAITRFKEEIPDSIDLLLARPTDGTASVIFTSEFPEGDMESMSILGALLDANWSPDSQWLILVAVREDIAGLYVLNQATGEAYLVQDITGTHAPHVLGWLP